MATGTDRPAERRGAVRTGVVWAAVSAALSEPGAFAGERARVVDIGGGTGGFAVPLAELGHRVLVVDPSPDALAALSRRASESGVTDLVTGVQGDLAGLAELVQGEADFRNGADLVLCHGVLGVVDDPAAALATTHAALRPGGLLSLLVAQRYAAVVARAMTGHFQAARDLLDAGEDSMRTGHRYTVDEIRAQVTAAGLEVTAIHGIRVFADLVPGSLLDLEPGAAPALVELERAVAERPEFLPLATQLHLVARR